MKIAPHQLEKMRADARLELYVLYEHRSRQGEDPADFVHELPSADELVVAAIRDDELHDSGLAAQHGMARLAGLSSLPDAAQHRQNADDVEFELLRRIALEHPSLMRAAWSMMGRIRRG
ncbi:hypothetical protein ACUWEX_00150 [Okibacterium fritillariae]|uniref:Uncharacterized protein n=1 Tax=Okibacterium fritillariae TaxID=123320 RepID=A0A1T5I7N1_9MICO|nr:hypothetical protein [Okibacterium fritillariae]SKC35186.1 hypothetical protein SAMN06309945_0027 [Okibacterium fritillariae]